MSVDYAELAQTAADLIGEFGAPALIHRKARPSPKYDVAKGAPTDLTETTVQTVAVVLNYDMKFVDGTLVLANDKRAYVQAAQPLLAGDGLTFSNERFKVVDCKPLAPAGQVVFYQAQLRK